MPITTNETLSSGSSDSLRGDPSKNADSNRSGGAAGVEVPVIVHASRYSSSANSVGKSLPPVHEETRTVIVFEQGAVVRLSAAVTTGEVVVLTNKLTGADVICKVGNVKAQPGIQNYVSLEFTQRAPGFWGDSSSQASHTPQAAVPVEPTPAAIPAPVLTPRPVEAVPTPPPKPAPVAADPVEAPPAPAYVAPAPPVASYEHKPIAVGISESISSPSAVVAAPAPPPRVFDAGATLTPTFGSASASRRPIELGAPSQESGGEGKNIALIAVAAVVLLFAGGAGGWLLLRPSQSAQPTQAASAATQPAAQSSETASRSEAPAAPDPVLPGLPQQAQPETVASAAAPRADLRSTSREEAPAIQPAVAKSAIQPVAAASASAPSIPARSESAPVTEASHRPVLDVGKMAAPSAKKRAATSASSEAPPELLAQSGTNSASSLNEGLLSASARNIGPSAPSAFPSAPAKGGQIVQPKLISSPAALYPAEARAAHIQGDVAIDAFIDETGRVAATKVISGPPILQQTAMNAVRSWKYQPARLDGQPVSIHIRVDVNFQLQ